MLYAFFQPGIEFLHYNPKAFELAACDPQLPFLVSTLGHLHWVLVLSQQRGTLLVISFLHLFEVTCRYGSARILLQVGMFIGAVRA